MEHERTALRGGAAGMGADEGVGAGLAVTMRIEECASAGGAAAAVLWLQAAAHVPRREGWAVLTRKVPRKAPNLAAPTISSAVQSPMSKASRMLSSAPPWARERVQEILDTAPGHPAAVHSASNAGCQACGQACSHISTAPLLTMRPRSYPARVNRRL